MLLSYITQDLANNYSNFQVIMSVNGISRYLDRLQCDREIPMIAVRDRVTGPAKPLRSAACVHRQRNVHFQIQASEDIILFLFK